MKVTFWGTRGSIPKAGPTTLRYGGNTSCIEVRSDDGTLVVVDCGTGAHGLGEALAAEPAELEGHLLITHTHWDHIQGLPFFRPLFDPDGRWSIYGPRGLGESIGETLAGQMQYTYFPVTLEDLSAEIDYHDLVEGCFEIGDVRVYSRYLNHPALTLAYRLEVDGATVVYASDHEPHDPALAHGGDMTSSPEDADHSQFLRDADLVIHDCQYTAAEYGEKIGWGHSPIEYAVDAAGQAGAAVLALHHHDPGRDDSAVEALLEGARAQVANAGYEMEVIVATEGDTIELRGEGASRGVDSDIPTTAMAIPAVDGSDLSVLVAVRDAEIAAGLRAAVEAEGLEGREAAGRASALDRIRAHKPALIVLEDDDEGGDIFDLTSAIRAMASPYGDEVALVTVSRSGAGVRTDGRTDWLQWPASPVYLRTKLRAWLLRRACGWQNAPLPSDEDRRLAALRSLDLLDTAAEPRFDRLTGVASRIFDVPVALVSFVDDDRQWFKSHHGLDARETPRDLAFCAHAILDDEVLQVPDALADPRFRDNPLVRQDPRVRFYAGVPLTLDDGSRVGTLCVIDHRPRLLDTEELAQLRRLGRMVERELTRTPT